MYSTLQIVLIVIFTIMISVSLTILGIKKYFTLLNDKAFEEGFRYGYDHNPYLDDHEDKIKESLTLLKGITLYKKNKKVVNKVITILEKIDSESTAIASNES